MNSFTTERASILYNQKIHYPSARKSLETSEAINGSLPHIQFKKSVEKANVLRNQLNDTMSEIAIMQSKINNLRKLKQRHDQKNHRNITKIQFMTSIKERVRHDFEEKQKIQRQKQEQLETLKYQTQSLRQSLVAERKHAQNQLYTIKYNEAEEERRRKKHHEYLRQKLKELDTLEINKKVDKIKQFHENSSSRLKDMQHSRVTISRENYHSKVISTLKEKERAKSLLQKLRLQQQRLIQDVKVSEQTMLTSLYSLQSLNPEKAKRKFNTLQKSNQHEKQTSQMAEYQSEEFES